MKKFIVVLIAFLYSICTVLAEEASANFNITLPAFVKIESVLSPVLVANITDRTGNLYAPLCSKFKVISNSAETKRLYLKANVATDSGLENSMFEQGGMVYIAFANLAKLPTSQSLANCKMGSLPKDSPGIVAYPVTSVIGAKHKFVKDKYEVFVENGESFITINIGSNVQKNSFAANDARGFYQAILSLTEADI